MSICCEQAATAPISNLPGNEFVLSDESFAAGLLVISNISKVASFQFLDPALIESKSGGPQKSTPYSFLRFSLVA